MDLKQHIRSIPDFPKPGILFYDISTLLAHPQAWRATVERLARALEPQRPEPTIEVGGGRHQPFARGRQHQRSGLFGCDESGRA